MKESKAKENNKKEIKKKLLILGMFWVLVGRKKKEKKI